MSNQLKVGVTDPVIDGGFGSREEVVQHGDFVSEEHQTVNEMRSDESCASGNKNAFARCWGKEFDRGETRKSGVRDRLGLGVVDRLRLIRRVALNEPGVLGFCLCVGFGHLFLTLASGHDVVRAQVKRPQNIDRDLTVEAKTLESDRFNFLAILVQSVNLCSRLARCWKKESGISETEGRGGKIFDFTGFCTTFKNRDRSDEIFLQPQVGSFQR